MTDKIIFFYNDSITDNPIKSEDTSEIVVWTEWEVNTILSKEEELFTRVFFKTLYIWRRKIDIKAALWIKLKEKLNVDSDLSIDYAKLRPLIWQVGIDTTKEFIDMNWKKAFLKILKKLVD